MITVRGGGFNVSSTAVLQLTNNSLQVQATASPVSMSQCNNDLSLSLSSRLAVCQTTQLQVVARHPCPEPTPTVHPCYVLSV